MKFKFFDENGYKKVIKSDLLPGRIPKDFWYVIEHVFLCQILFVVIS